MAYPSVPAPLGIPRVPYYRFMALLEAANPKRADEDRLDESVRRWEEMKARREAREARERGEGV